VKKFLPGDLVTIKITDLSYTEDGFSTGGMVNGCGLKLFENIDLNSYPSSNDFFGQTTTVFDNDVAIVIKYIGRPCKVAIDPAWFKYDIYEIFVRGQRRQIFRQNMS